MATFEETTRETSRFEAVDAHGRRHVVVEHTTFLVRVGFIKKPHPPEIGRRTYSLLTGHLLNITSHGRFDSVDGRLRLQRVPCETGQEAPLT